jgi:hypothetical protein
LAEICAASDSICEKSGLTVASTTKLGLGTHLPSTPTSPSAPWFSSELPRPPSGSAVWLPVAKGATTQWLPDGSPASPTSGRVLQMKQLLSRGSREVNIW